MQTDIQKLATQQSQIQRMMQSPPKPAAPQNPMDPQPFYIAGMEQQQQQPLQPLQVQPSPQRRTWGQPHPQQPYGQQPPYGMQQQNPYGQFAPQPYNSPYQQPGPAAPYPALPSPGQAPGTPARPFRLHESPSPGRPAAYQEPPGPSPRREAEPPAVEPRRIHTALPAPAADDMAPQNVSFIQDSTDNDEDDKSISPVPPAPASGETARSDSNLSERLSRLNISRGDKTYRVQLHADGREPTALEQQATSPRPSTRPTISSTFKERRRGSSEGSGPGSLSGPGSIPAVQSKLSVEEIDALNTMKTEVLNETGDPAKGFVISFDDDSPIKPKPVLKPRRMSKKGSRDEMKSSDPVMIMLDMNDDGEDSEP